MSRQTSGARRPETSGLPARRAGLEVLRGVLKDGVALDAALDETAAFTALNGADRRFARALVSTVLRRKGRIDAVLGRLLDKRPPAKARDIVHILQIGVAELVFLHTPAHAGVASAVAVAGQGRHTQHFKGLVNAVLRRVDREKDALTRGLSPVDDWPTWLVESWRNAYGPHRAQAIAEACGNAAPLDVTVKTRADQSHWVERLDGTAIGPSTVRLTAGGDVSALAGFSDGAWWVQDAAAALPVQLLGDVSGRNVLDLCAAPGGKTLQLAAAGATVTAVDKSAARLERLSDNLKRTQLDAAIVQADARDSDRLAALGPFDAILVDAPCTATGTLRRRPDVAAARHPQDVDNLAQLQTDILASAARALKPGGSVVFCTCSLQPEEGAPVIAAALAAGAPLRLDPITNTEVPDGFSRPLADGTLRTSPTDWADAGGCDGFFMARLTRTS